MPWDHLLPATPYSARIFRNPGLTLVGYPPSGGGPSSPLQKDGPMRNLGIAFLSLLSGACLAAAPDFSQVGFSTMDGGTTGGKGGQVVRPADIAELKKYA